MPRIFGFASLLIIFCLLAASCGVLEVGILRTPTPDYDAIGTLASLMIQGTVNAARATELAIPVTPTPSTGVVQGSICYPIAERIPSMDIYFKDVESGRLIRHSIEENQASYSVNLEPGRYLAYAWVEQYQVGGMYTHAVPCGLGDECSDHAPLEFEAAAGAVTNEIDICDWAFSINDLPIPKNIDVPGSPPIQ